MSRFYTGNCIKCDTRAEGLRNDGRLAHLCDDCADAVINREECSQTGIYAPYTTDATMEEMQNPFG